MKKLGLVAIITASLALSSCGKKTELPEEFQSINPVAKQYLLAAVEDHNESAYKSAINSVEDPELKKQIADFASGKFFESAQLLQSPSGSVTGFFLSLERAIEFEPEQEEKERLIDFGMGSVKFYAEKKDSYFSLLATNYLAFCAKHTTDPDKRTRLASRAADIYTNAAERESHGRGLNHLYAAKYLEIAQTLRKGNF